jgi:hypothetical protein
MVCSPGEFKAENDSRVPGIVFTCDMDPHIALCTRFPSIFVYLRCCLVALIVSGTDNIGDEVVIERAEQFRCKPVVPTDHCLAGDRNPLTAEFCRLPVIRKAQAVLSMHQAGQQRPGKIAPGEEFFLIRYPFKVMLKANRDDRDINSFVVIQM